MPVRPVVGIATQSQEAVAGQLPPTWIMGQKYVRVLTAYGGVPWVIPLLMGDEPTLAAIYGHLDGVLLTGGVDVDPACYHEPRHPLCGKTDPPRDWTEARLVRWAIRDHKPLLGVCRGIQLINVAAGGTLYQDIPAQLHSDLVHDSSYARQDWTYMAHDLRLAPDSKLAQLFETTSFPINSLHHQSLKTIAPGLRPVGWAPDGVIEAVEGANGHFLIGVQCHPEALESAADPRWKVLFKRFVDSCRA